MTANLTKRPLFREIQDYVFIAIGMISYAIGWNVFLLPTNVTASGLPGISSIIYWATGCPVQIPYFIVNSCLIVAAWIILGKKFCMKTIYAVIVVTLLTSYFSHHTENLHLLQSQPLWAAFLGAVFCGCGIGLGFSAGGSTGGTDIVAAIVNKYRDISLGRVIMICDIFIICSPRLGESTLWICSTLCPGFLYRPGGQQSSPKRTVLHHFQEISGDRQAYQYRCRSWSNRSRCLRFLFRSASKDAFRTGQAAPVANHLPPHRRDRPSRLRQPECRDWRIWRRLRPDQG